jgi:Na+/H+ antiporter NhaD/arsenite permease-like protein
MASSVGSAATITVNPQNTIVGAISRIPYAQFAAALAPTAMLGAALVVVLVAAFSPREFLPVRRFGAGGAKARVNKPQMIKATLVTIGVVALFFAGAPVGEAAMLGGVILLVTRSIKAHEVYRQIDGSLLLFAGLFVVVAGAENFLLPPDLLALAHSAHLENVGTLTATTAALSNVISNAPATLALEPFVRAMPDPHRVRLVVAMSSTLAGNLTLVGSVANLIVAEKARRAGIEISFWRYARIGVPLTLITLRLGAWRLS